jgi:hypothetical protein
MQCLEVMHIAHRQLNEVKSMNKEIFRKLLQGPEESQSAIEIIEKIVANQNELASHTAD